MKTSAERVHSVHRELMWGGAIWFLSGIIGAIGKWLEIDAVKMDKTGALLWFGFGGVLVVGKLVADCADAILAGVAERNGSEASES
jgi:hypothetical protein